jgi:hypothetical protein
MRTPPHATSKRLPSTPTSTRASRRPLVDRERVLARVVVRRVGTINIA